MQENKKITDVQEYIERLTEEQKETISNLFEKVSKTFFPELEYILLYDRWDAVLKQHKVDHEKCNNIKWNIRGNGVPLNKTYSLIYKFNPYLKDKLKPKEMMYVVLLRAMHGSIKFGYLKYLNDFFESDDPMDFIRFYIWKYPK